MIRPPLAIALAVMLALTPAGAQQLPDLGESSQTELSPAVERRIGESFMRDIRLRDPAYVDDPELEEYINAVGGRLVSASEGARQDFQFFLLKDATLNAFAMPGGFVGVHTGLILAAQTESELAGVLAHEIAHVTQRHIARMVSKQAQGNLLALAAMVVAVLASRSNSQVAEAALTAGMAAGVQTQLNYSRDFEREADRIGLQTLERSGLDVSGMTTFFERLQRASRVIENNAPAYLRTHPLTTERIADMENRAHQMTYRQVPDSLTFQLVRAKLRAQQGSTAEAVADLESLLRERKFASEAAIRYGLGVAYLRSGSTAQAMSQLDALGRMKAAHPMIESLAADTLTASGDRQAAERRLREARNIYPDSRPLVYRLTEAQLGLPDPKAALATVSAEVQLYPADARLWALQARAYSGLGMRLHQHRSQAEVYALHGQLPAAIEQLQLAQQAADGNFYEQSAVDARLRELKARQVEEMRERKSR